MSRFLGGAAACFLFLTGALLFWQSRAAENPRLPAAPPAHASGTSVFSARQPLEAPEASPKSREEKRFAAPTRTRTARSRAKRCSTATQGVRQARLQRGRDAQLRGMGGEVHPKFKGADSDRTGWLTPAEYATTAPPPPKKKSGLQRASQRAMASSTGARLAGAPARPRERGRARGRCRAACGRPSSPAGRAAASGRN